MVKILERLDAETEHQAAFAGNCQCSLCTSSIQVCRMQDEWCNRKHSVPTDMVVIGFVTENVMTVSLADSKIHTFKTGDWFFLANSDELTQLSLPSDVLGLLLCSPLSYFRNLLCHRGEVPVKLSCLNCPCLDRVMFEHGRMSGRMNELVRAIQIEKMISFSSQFVIASHAIGLLASVLLAPNFESGCCCNHVHNEDDVAALNSVAHYLETALEEEHTLQQLCQRFHINEFKLKKGFREQYGKTVFQYLRQKRMARAHRRFREGASSVMEVACEVGYSNASHFARAFRGEFGQNPSDLLHR